MTQTPVTKRAYRQEIDRVNRHGPHTAFWEELGSYEGLEW